MSSSSLAVLDIALPSALRPVAPFLEEAQAIVRTSVYKEEDGEIADIIHRRNVAIYCIDHAFHLVETFGLVLDEESRSVLQAFLDLRESMASTIASSERREVAPQVQLPEGKKKANRPNPEDILVAEATATLELAEKMLKENMHREAARNFHTATVYFRVLENLVPSLTSEIHERLEFAAYRTRQCSHLLENFIRENFEGKKFSDFYEIYERNKLGKGSYGSVYLCRHRRTQDEFACKVISLNRINSHYLRKLHLEISIMKQVDHPNIVKLKEVFFGSRTVYLVMEVCHGGELFDYLQSQGSRGGLTEAAAAKIVRDMLSAVLYLHEKGIVHRDLKLENFLFESRDPNSSMKLIDFGLSKHFTEHDCMHQVVGSAYYTAPEVLGGSYDQRCDVWSIGVIAYMLLSGSPPFYGESSEDIHKMIREKNAEFPDKKFGTASESTIDFLRKMLTKDPSKRITLSDALLHPFIQRVDQDIAARTGGSAKSESSADVVHSLKGFLQMSKFKKLMLEVVAFTLNSSQIAELREEFQAMDKDRNGTISMAELQRSMAGIRGREATDEEMKQLCQELNVSEDSTINYHEFISAAMGRRITVDEERLQIAFETLDIDNTGYLDASSICRALGNDVTTAEIEEMMKEVDQNQDGKISYKEFLSFYREMMIKSRLTPLKRFASAVRRVSMGLLFGKLKGLKAMTSGSESSSMDTEQISATASLQADVTMGESKFDGQEQNQPRQQHSTDKESLATEISDLSVNGVDKTIGGDVARSSSKSTVQTKPVGIIASALDTMSSLVFSGSAAVANAISASASGMQGEAKMPFIAPPMNRQPSHKLSSPSKDTYEDK